MTIETEHEIEAAVAHLMAPRFRLISPGLLEIICRYRTCNGAWVRPGGAVTLRLSGTVDFIAIGPLPHRPARS